MKTEIFEKRYIGLADCEVCYGSGLTPITDSRGNTSMARCDCFHRARIKPMVRASGIPANYHDASFKGMVFNTDNQKLAFKTINGWVKEFALKSRGLFFCGNEGTGKTRMMCATAIRLIEKMPVGSTHPIQPFYWSTTELMAEIKDGFDNEYAEDALYKAKTCSVLFLDDVGAEQSTPFSVSCVVEIMDARYSNGLTTCLASNLDNKALANRYDPRFAGRVREMCTTLILDGKSHRVEVTA